MRYKYLDTTRISLMILGVFYHAALMFNIDYDWVVSFDTRELALTKFEQIVHLFRMEAFFVIAAFLAAAVLHKYERLEFLKKRFIRLIIPFWIGFIAMNFLVVPLISGKPLVSDQLFHLHHLWFLIVLFTATLLHQFLFRPEVLQRSLPKTLPVPAIIAVPAIFIIASISIAAIRFVSIKYLPYWTIGKLTNGFINVSLYVHYLPFYFLGAVLYNYREKMDALLKCWPIFIVMVIVYLLHLPVFAWSWTISHAVSVLASLALVGLVLTLFRFVVPQSLSRPWMSNYSYSMYLIHQPLLYLLRDPIMHVAKTTSVRFGLISTATIVICTLAHWIIARSRVLSLLFNGELNPENFLSQRVSKATSLELVELSRKS